MLDDPDNIDSTANAIGNFLVKRDENFRSQNRPALSKAYNEISAHGGPGGYYSFLNDPQKHDPKSELFLRCLEEDRCTLKLLKKHIPFIIQDTEEICFYTDTIIRHIMTLDGQMTAVDMYREQAKKFETLPNLIETLDKLSARHQECLNRWRKLFGTHTFNLEYDPAPIVASAPSPPNR